MGKKGNPHATGSFIFDLHEIISEVRRDAEERKTDRPDPLGDATGIRVHPIVKISWAQRVLSWFRRQQHAD